MKKTIAVAAFLLAATAVKAQDIINVPLTAQERSVVLAMCYDATWASRRALNLQTNYDGACEYFRNKFDALERAAAKVAAEKPADKAAEAQKD